MSHQQTKGEQDAVHMVHELETRDEALQRGADAKILERAKELFGPLFWRYDLNGRGQYDPKTGTLKTNCEFLIATTLASFHYEDGYSYKYGRWFPLKWDTDEPTTSGSGDVLYIFQPPPAPFDHIVFVDGPVVHEMVGNLTNATWTGNGWDPTPVEKTEPGWAGNSWGAQGWKEVSGLWFDIDNLQWNCNKQGESVSDSPRALLEK